jgi:ATP-dependent Zn protease
VLFEMPGPVEREQIWRVQMHPSRTPLSDDVDFKVLAERYAVSGGDIRNAVLKAALAAAAEPGPDSVKRIHQRHFEAGIEDVIAAKQVMRQSLFSGDERLPADANQLAGAVAAHASRLLIYALVLGGAALAVAVIALTLAVIR